MKKIGDRIHTLVHGANWVAAGALIIMMLLTCSDIVLRFFRHPIPGTYEVVGLLGAVVIAFAFAYTTMEKGHIAVEFIVQRLPRKIQEAVDAVNQLIAFLLLGIVGWQSTRYALELRASGEVSPTIQMPIYPFILSIALGCLLVCIVVAHDFFVSLTMLKSK